MVGTPLIWNVSEKDSEQLTAEPLLTNSSLANDTAIRTFLAAGQRGATISQCWTNHFVLLRK